MNLFITQQHRDAPNIWYFPPWELFIGQRGGWTELLLKLNILLGWADMLHQIKVIKRQNALLNLLYHYIVLQWDDLIKDTVEPLFIWRGVQRLSLLKGLHRNKYIAVLVPSFSWCLLPVCSDCYGCLGCHFMPWY